MSVWDDLMGLNVTRTTADTLKLQSLLRFHTVSVHLSACIICLSCCTIYLSICPSVRLSVCLFISCSIVLFIFIYSWMNVIKMVEGHF